MCRDVISFPGFVDTMYRDTPDELLLDNGLGTKLSIKNKGSDHFSLNVFHLQMLLLWTFSISLTHVLAA